MTQMIIANRLEDGLVVFFVSPGNWVEDIGRGLLISAAEDADAILATAKDDENGCLVIDPNLIEVETTDGQRRRPTAMREAIRAFGPSPEARTDRIAAR